MYILNPSGHDMSKKIYLRPFGRNMWLPFRCTSHSPTDPFFTLKPLKTWTWKFGRNSKTQIAMKLKNSNVDKIKKIRLWQNSKTQIVTKLEANKKTQKLKLWWNSKTQTVTKLKLRQMSIDEEEKLKGYFSENILTPWQPMRCS